jgi:hypothetical protein
MSMRPRVNRGCRMGMAASNRLRACAVPPRMHEVVEHVEV